MEETRVYLFKRLEHLVKQIAFLYGEAPDIRSAQRAHPHFGDEFESTVAFLQRRVAFLPSQIDGSLREAVVVLQTLREMNSVAVKLTGSLTENPAHAVAPLVTQAKNRALAQHAEVQPARQVRPPIHTAKSASSLRAGLERDALPHPAYRQEHGR